MKVRTEVVIEYREIAVLKKASESVVVKSSKQFNENLSKITGSAEISGSYGVASGSVSAAWDNLDKLKNSSKNYSFTSHSDMVEYQAGTTQIYRVVTYNFTLDGNTAKVVGESHV